MNLDLTTRIRNKKFFNVINFVLLITLFSSCSTKRNSFLRRTYHNLTSYYNAYWNGYESFENALQYIENNTIDNYNEILPINKYGTEEQLPAIITSLNRTQEKAAKVIQKHSMRFKGKEYVQWIDDCYLLLGKAYFYKGEYVSARRTFNFIVQEFSDKDTRFDAIIWLAKTANRKGEYENSENILLELQSMMDEENVPHRVRQELPLVFAELYQLQKKYTLCADFISRGLKLSTQKKLIIRLKFILAQIYQQEGRYSESSILFEEVIRQSSDYRIVFQAKLNLALSYDNKRNIDEIENILLKMLAKSENEPFKDQIYFSLAGLALRSQKKEKAIEHLKYSVTFSKKNQFQKTKSSLLLADIFYENNNFSQAGLYYDTAHLSIPQNFPDAEIIKFQLIAKINLVQNLQIVQVQDSLRRIASMSEAERNAIIDLMIEKNKEAVLKNQLEQKTKLSSREARISDINFFIGTSNEKLWYFNNPTTLNYGFNQFIKRWGQRVLEDNWRLSKKQIKTDITFARGELPNMEYSADTLERNLISTGTKTQNREYYIKNLPLTPEMIALSDSIIVEALFTAGILYKDNLNDSVNAYNVFTELLERYPKNSHTLETYYYLFKLSDRLNKLNEANDYKSKILNEFPTSNYAKIIIDPQYFLRINKQHSEVEKYYSEVYKAFINEQYFLVVDLCEKALENVNNNELIPKFDYLKVLSQGKIGKIEDLIEGLQRIINTYPESQIIPLAKDILKTLIPEKTISKDYDTTKFVSVFKFSQETFHNYILIVKIGSVNLDAIKIRLSDFNNKYSRNQRFSISSFKLNEEYQLITVSRFGNGLIALGYLKAIENDNYVLSMFSNKEDYMHFVISNENYLLLYKEKNVGDYYKFFKRYYQNDENSN